MVSQQGGAGLLGLCLVRCVQQAFGGRFFWGVACGLGGGPEVGGGGVELVAHNLHSGNH